MIEVVNTANLVDILDTMTDPYLREATRQLLADEVFHGTFGFEYLAAWGPWLDAHPRFARLSTASSASRSPSWRCAAAA